MRGRMVTYVTGLVRAEDETDLAFKCSFDWSSEGYVGRSIWIPKANLSEDSRQEIEDAIAGEMIEVSIAKWWLDQEL